MQKGNITIIIISRFGCPSSSTQRTSSSRKIHNKITVAVFMINESDYTGFVIHSSLFPFSPPKKWLKAEERIQRPIFVLQLLFCVAYVKHWTFHKFQMLRKVFEIWRILQYIQLSFMFIHRMFAVRSSLFACNDDVAEKCIKHGGHERKHKHNHRTEIFRLQCSLFGWHFHPVDPHNSHIRICVQFSVLSASCSVLMLLLQWNRWAQCWAIAFIE